MDERPGNSSYYIYNGQPRAYDIHTEVIKVMKRQRQRDREKET